jgi:hypothetical protein
MKIVPVLCAEIFNIYMRISNKSVLYSFMRLILPDLSFLSTNLLSLAELLYF